MKDKCMFSLLIFLMTAGFAHAALKSEIVEYSQGNTKLEGYLVYAIDQEHGLATFQDTKRPGVIVVHDWMGFGDYGNKRADMLAELGYVAFAVDIYGKGVRPQNTEEASRQAGIYKNDRALMRERAKAGLDFLKQNPLVNPDQIAAIGYCFGGTVVLEMVRAGHDLTGVVSFHGGLSTPNAEDAKNIKGKVLVLHGADDPFVPSAEVDAFKKEMEDANVDMDFIAYPGAVHSFTRWDAGNDNSKGAAYNEAADKKSWEDMKDFFVEIFPKKMDGTIGSEPIIMKDVNSDQLERIDGVDFKGIKDGL